MPMYVFMYVCIYIWGCSQRSEEALDSMELELQSFLSCLTWMLGSRPWSCSGMSQTLIRLPSSKDEHVLSLLLCFHVSIPNLLHTYHEVIH